MNNIQNYNKRIADQLLRNQWDSLHKDEELRGSGSYSNSSKPLPITGAYSPSFEAPTSSINTSSRGGKLPKALRDLGHEASHILAPALKRGASKVANALVDKGTDYLINSMSQSSGEGLHKKRGRPRKHTEERHEHGGKFNFIKTMDRISKNPIVKKLGDKALDAGIQMGTQALMSSAMAAGMPRKKRQPSRRNQLVKEIMQKHRCTLAEASRHIKEHNLK